MQVNNINSGYQAPNFTALKSINYAGLYKKYPEVSQKMLEAFKANDKALDFCKKFDVDVVFFASKEGITGVNNYLLMRYRNIATTAFEKLMNVFKPKKEVKLYSFGNEYDYGSSLAKSADELRRHMLPDTVKGGNGLLDWHINSAIKEHEKELAEIAEKNETKIEKQKVNKETANKKISDKKLLAEETKKFLDSQN